MQARGPWGANCACGFGDRIAWRACETELTLNYRVWGPYGYFGHIGQKGWSLCSLSCAIRPVISRMHTIALNVMNALGYCGGTVRGSLQIQRDGAELLLRLQEHL